MKFKKYWMMKQKTKVKFTAIWVIFQECTDEVEDEEDGEYEN